MTWHISLVSTLLKCDLLRWRWLMGSNRFQGYISMTHDLYIALRVSQQVKSSSTTKYSVPFPPPQPSPNFPLVTAMLLPVSASFGFMSHVWVTSYGSSLFLPDLFCLAWWSRGPPTLLQMAGFHLSLRLSSVPSCMCEPRLLYPVTRQRPRHENLCSFLYLRSLPVAFTFAHLGWL